MLRTNAVVRKSTKLANADWRYRYSNRSWSTKMLRLMRLERSNAIQQQQQHQEHDDDDETVRYRSPQDPPKFPFRQAGSPARNLQRQIRPFQPLQTLPG